MAMDLAIVLGGTPGLVRFLWSARKHSDKLKNEWWNELAFYIWFILVFKSWQADTNNGHDGAQQNGRSHGYEGHLQNVNFDIW